MQQRQYRGFDIVIHAHPQGGDHCFLLTDISCGGLSWGRSQRVRFVGNCKAHEDAEMTIAMATVDGWAGRSSAARVHAVDVRRGGAENDRIGSTSVERNHA